MENYKNYTKFNNCYKSNKASRPIRKNFNNEIEKFLLSENGKEFKKDLYFLPKKI